jgi:hypothetical protein
LLNLQESLEREQYELQRKVEVSEANFIAGLPKMHAELHGYVIGMAL